MPLSFYFALIIQLILRLLCLTRPIFEYGLFIVNYIGTLKGIQMTIKLVKGNGVFNSTKETLFVRESRIGTKDMSMDG